MTHFVKLTTPELNDLLINMEKVLYIRIGETAAKEGVIKIIYDAAPEHLLIYSAEQYSTYTDSAGELLDCYHEKRGDRDPTEKIRACLDKRR